MSHNIWLAASDGDLEAVKKFVEERGVSVDAQDEYGYSALHAAASYGYTELIEYLLGKGANVNIQDPDGDTPLFVCETVEMAQLLIAKGADPKHINENEMTAADNAEEEEWSEVAHYLRELTGVAHPDKDVDDLQEDMSYLLNASDASDDDGDDGNTTSNGKGKSNNGHANGSAPANNNFRDRIETIMRATEADGVNRDAQLTTVVTEMLSAAGPEAATALSEELQALESQQDSK
ncbi:ankyrin repeat-containing domain protein [Mortierella sp. GBAus27b]|nr:hypothetical protein BGX31_000830 [Mortierella sp. GBA43]KAI8353002.1 ankyrin repeat-containing domain protein [Mortierella sp. GBAus27b]